MPKCGECYYWMRSNTCPREKNIKGQSKGPSCNSPTLDCPVFKTEEEAEEEWKQYQQEKKDGKPIYRQRSSPFTHRL